MKEIFGIDSTMRNQQTTGRMRRNRPSRVVSMKVKRGPAKGNVITVRLHASIVVSMMCVLKGRRALKVANMPHDDNPSRFLTPEELTRRQMQLQRDSYRLSSAMNSSDLPSKG